MIYCHEVQRHGSANTQHDDTITLDETDRRRRRIRLCSDNGIEFVLELQSTTLLQENDSLLLSDGRSIRVQSKPESLYKVTGNDAAHLLTLAWHVGNRHLAAQISPDYFLIRKDTVIRTMLEELGASVSEVEAGFNPLGGAYDRAHSHAHAHTHDHA